MITKPRSNTTSPSHARNNIREHVSKNKSESASMRRVRYLNGGRTLGERESQKAAQEQRRKINGLGSIPPSHFALSDFPTFAVKESCSPRDNGRRGGSGFHTRRVRLRNIKREHAFGKGFRVRVTGMGHPTDGKVRRGRHLAFMTSTRSESGSHYS